MINYKYFEYNDAFVSVGTDEWKESVLSADPFMGDIGGGTRLSDKIVKTRNTLSLCTGCLSTCEKGTFNRVLTEADEGKLLRNRFCEMCCTSIGYEELCVGYEGRNKLETELFVPCYDENSAFFTDDEPITLEDHIYSIRTKHEKVLEKELGGRWFEKPDEVLYQVVSGIYD